MEGLDLYYGVDLGYKVTVVSFYDLNRKEPQTISMVMGSEDYQIPTALSKRNGIAQWFFGREAKHYAQEGTATEAEDLLEKAEKNQEIFLDGERYSARDLLAVYLKHLLEMNGIPLRRANVKKLSVALPNLNQDTVEMMTIVASKIGISSEQLYLLDQRECFYYYVLNQEPQLFLHDVMLFDGVGTKMMATRLHRDITKRPQLVTLEEKQYEIAGDDLDQEFRQISERAFSNYIISSVYLVGDSFDGNWLKQSLTYLVQGRRVFVGKNLYSKGACYAGMVREGEMDFPFLYVGDHEMKMTISLKVTDQKETKFRPLIQSGESWFKASGECEVLLDGTPEVEIYVQRADSHSAKVEVLSLTDLPDRENRTTRLRIHMDAKSDQEVEVQITDIGFGEIAPGSNRTWNHQVKLPEEA